MRLALVIGAGHAHDTAGSAVGNARDQALAARERQAGFGFAKAHQRTRLRTRNETATMDGNFAAGNRRRGRDPFDAWITVFF